MALLLPGQVYPGERRASKHILKKYQNVRDHMCVVSHLMRLYSQQARYVCDQFCSIIYQLQEQEYTDQPPVSQTACHLINATSARERAKARIDERRRRMASRKACMKNDSTTITHNQQKFPAKIAASESYAAAMKNPQPDLDSSEMKFQQPDPLNMDTFNSRAGDQSTLWSSIASEIAKDLRVYEAQIASRKINTKPCSAESCSISCRVRKDQMSREISVGSLRRAGSADLLHDISKITDMAERCASSDLNGPLHSTMADISCVNCYHPNTEIPEYRIMESVCSACSTKPHQVTRCSVNSSRDFIRAEMQQNMMVPQASATCDSVCYAAMPSRRCDVTGASLSSLEKSNIIIYNDGLRGAQIATSMDRQGVSLLDPKAKGTSLLEPNMDVYGSSPRRDSISPVDLAQGMNKYSSNDSSYKESDATANSSVENDHASYQWLPQVKRLVHTRSKQLASMVNNVTKSSSAPSSDSQCRIEVPENSPELLSLCSASPKPPSEQADAISLSQSSCTTDKTNQSSDVGDNDRPSCIGYTSATEHVQLVTPVFTYAVPGNDSGIGERPPCIGCSETSPYVMNRLAHLAVNAMNTSCSASIADNSMDSSMRLQQDTIGDRPPCIGVSFFGNGQLPYVNQVAPSGGVSQGDIDSGLSMSSPGVKGHSRNSYNPDDYTPPVEIVPQKATKKSLAKRFKLLGSLFTRHRRNTAKM